MSECYCDYDPPEFYNVELRTAAKEHRCDECRGVITPHEKYERAAGKWDGTVGDFKTCSRCVSLRDYVIAHVPCSCLSHGNLFDDVRYTIDEYRRECPGLMFGVGRLAVAIRNHNKQH